MVLFVKNMTTKAYLLTHRAFSTSKSSRFSDLIKDVQVPFKKGAVAEHGSSVKMWRNIFFLLGIPAIALVNLNAFVLEEQHPPRPDFKPYEHMRKRAKRFPWGDGNHSLFHNPYYNALPEGYETEDDYLEKMHGGHH